MTTIIVCIFIALVIIGIMDDVITSAQRRKTPKILNSSATISITKFALKFFRII